MSAPTSLKVFIIEADADSLKLIQRFLNPAVTVDFRDSRAAGSLFLLAQTNVIAVTSNVAPDPERFPAQIRRILAGEAVGESGAPYA